MGRYSASAVSAGAGSVTLPIGGVMAVAGSGFILRETGVFNTTTTAVVSGVALQRVTAAGTSGSTITAQSFDPNLLANASLAKNTWTVAPTLGNQVAELGVGAAVGAGTILTFYGEGSGIRVTLGTANGVVNIPLGTGQICNQYYVWDE